MAEQAEKLREFVDAPTVKKYFGAIVDDIEAALTEAGRNTSSGSMKHVTGKVLSTYKSDISALEKASDSFHNEWGNIIAEKATSLDAFERAYEVVLRELEIVELGNPFFTAVRETDVGGKVVAWVLIIEAVIKLAPRYVKLKSDLEKLKKDLEKLRKEVNAKSANAVIGVVITGITVAIPPAGIGTALAVAVSSAAVGMIIDEYVGNGASVSTLDAAHKATNAAYDCYDAAGKTTVKAFGKVNILMNTAKDFGDAGTAFYKKSKIESRLKAVEKEWNALLKELGKSAKTIRKARDVAQKALDDAATKANRQGSTSGERKRLKDEIAKWK
ncbi:MAG: hypothetical protein AAGC57_04635 [Pseudomonadota bacterium]